MGLWKTQKTDMSLCVELSSGLLGKMGHILDTNADRNMRS